MGGFPLFTTHLRAKTSIGGLRGLRPLIYGAKTSFGGSNGGNAPLFKKKNEKGYVSQSPGNARTGNGILGVAMMSAM